MLPFDWTTIAADYFHLVNTIVPGPQSWTFFVPHLLLPACLLAPPHMVSHNALATLMFPLILASTIHAVIAMRGPDVISMDTLWWSMYFLVFKDPRKDFRRVVETEREDKSIPRAEIKVVDWPYPSTSLARLQWTFTLLSERPLTSWKTGQTSHDINIPPLFVRRRRIRFVGDIMLILLPAIFVIMPLALRLYTLESLSNPYEIPGGLKSSNDNVLSHLPPQQFSIIRILDKFVPAPLLRSLAVGMFLYSFLIIHFLGVYLVPPLLSFIVNPASGVTHTWSTHLWPRPHFGPFTAVLDSGLGGLWGTWWHQQMRHAVSEPGRWLSDRLGLGRGLVRYSIICGGAFFLSGITHMGLVPPEAPNAWKMRFMIGGFFFSQPVGIVLEVLVLERILGRVEGALSRSRASTVVTRTLRLCWVLFFMSVPLSFLAEPFDKLGYWKIWPWFFLGETTKSILRGNWIP